MKSLVTSESEYSDNESGQVLKLKSAMSKVRLSALSCLQTIFKRCRKATSLGYWHYFIPDSTESKAPSIFTCITKDNSIKCRQGGLFLLTALFDGSKSYLTAANYKDKSNGPFISFSFTLASMLHEVHRSLIKSLQQANSNQLILQILKCLAVVVTNTPYNRLQEGFLSKIIDSILHYMYKKDHNIRVAFLACLTSVISTEGPSSEMQQLLSASVYPGYNFKPIDNAHPLSNHSPWLIKLCSNLLYESKQVTNLDDSMNSLSLQSPIAEDALQVLIVFAANYPQIVRKSLHDLKNIASDCMADGDRKITLYAVKLLEEIARIRQRNIAEADANNKEAYLLEAVNYWKYLLSDVLQNLSQPSVNSTIRAAGCDCLSMIGAEVFQELPMTLRIFCMTTLLTLCKDENPFVKASAVRCVGVFTMYPMLRDDTSFTADCVIEILNAIENSQLNVRVKAAWSLANVIDAMVVNRSQYHENFSMKLISRIYAVILKATDDNDKIKFNIMRALGNMLQFLSSNHLEKEEFQDYISKSMALLSKSVGSGMMKVRWNACSALGKMFQNTAIAVGAIKWTTSVFNTLMFAIETCKNFKVRITAAQALSSASDRRCYGDPALYASIWKSYVVCLSSSAVTTDFNEYRHLNNLKDQVAMHLNHCGHYHVLLIYFYNNQFNSFIL
ncbi:uncharacterized protein TRIADDRAFT_26416 [Trichoplax adhaerens]|uniref:HEAT repeat-containing protein 6 n=1 Tax=Trichoplax adhaerens TaxID=10228 RepID=B3RZ04_TRIAD|nr:hypothetical protein TRIADDRAFT_26416 [Trichoplax adhaerens]EDV24117.1 hypothetical protein TRIADDRAFT_26416 [Trichoplax adhaerens]|eukprot:XP_002113643.1 hypothetical protein TRIADDRAFT_26416 [Trichoplax adhaerens]